MRTVAEKNYCKANGFDSNVLECSTCSVVKDYIPDKEIQDICLKCCNDFITEKVPRAFFDYDENRITAELLQFVRNDAPNIKNLFLRTRPGALCDLTLVDAAGNVVDQFSVVEWSTKDVKEFLEDRLSNSTAPYDKHNH